MNGSPCQGLVICVSGPSGVGKGTVIRKDMTVNDGIFPPDKVQSIQNTCETLLALIMHTSKPVK